MVLLQQKTSISALIHRELKSKNLSLSNIELWKGFATQGFQSTYLVLRLI